MPWWMPDWLLQALETAALICTMLIAGSFAAAGVIWAYGRIAPDLPVDVVDKLTKR